MNTKDLRVYINIEVVGHLKVLAIDKIDNGETDLEVGEGLGIQRVLKYLHGNED